MELNAGRVEWLFHLGTDPDFRIGMVGFIGRKKRKRNESEKEQERIGRDDRLVKYVCVCRNISWRHFFSVLFHAEKKQKTTTTNGTKRSSLLSF
jgi:hypothetical protein